jgi:glutathione S-transferase
MQQIRILHGARLADRPSKSNVVLYTHVLCPYAQRVALALLYKVPASMHFLPRQPRRTPHAAPSAAWSCGGQLLPPCPLALAPALQRLAFDMVQIDLSAKPAWYRRVNPRGLVPALQHAGGTVVESMDILRWAGAL